MDQLVVDAIASPSIPAIAQPPVYAPWYEVLLDFLANITGSMAWPGALLIIALLFRKEIVTLVQNIESVKVAGVEAKIRKGLQQVEEELKATEPVTEDVAKLNSEEFKRLLTVAETSPTGAIIDAFKQVEELADELVRRELPRLREYPDGRRMPTIALHKNLLSLGVIPRSEANTFQKLRELRNRAAHAFDSEITSETAKEYVRLADRFADVLNQALTSPEIQMSLFNQA